MLFTFFNFLNFTWTFITSMLQTTHKNSWMVTAGTMVSRFHSRPMNYNSDMFACCRRGRYDTERSYRIDTTTIQYRDWSIFECNHAYSCWSARKVYLLMEFNMADVQKYVRPSHTIRKPLIPHDTPMMLISHFFSKALNFASAHAHTIH